MILLEPVELFIIGTNTTSPIPIFKSLLGDIFDPIQIEMCDISLLITDSADADYTESLTILEH